MKKNVSDRTPQVDDDPFEHLRQERVHLTPDQSEKDQAEIVCCANATYSNFDSLLLQASGASLLYEVVWFALWHMKKNPKLSEEEALEFGFNEWVK